jgi:predicted RNA-binding protein
VIKMCESTAYTTDGTKIMEDVISVKIDGENIYLEDILSQKKELTGRIVEIDLDKHGIYIQLI